MPNKPHHKEDEVIATEAVDPAILLTDNKALQEENKSLQERLLRALADAENVRRQADRTAADARHYALTEFSRALLVVVDNLERSVEAARQHPAADGEKSALLEGVEATLRLFLQTLDRFGIKPIDAQGRPFDPNLHEAVAAVADSSVPPGTVKEVMEKGYMLRDRVLRAARVVVAKEPEKQEPKGTASPQEDDNDLGSLWGASSN
jgi:molecular chaperone GrpE